MMVLEDIVTALQKTQKRVGTIDRGCIAQAITEITRLRMVIRSQADEINRLNQEALDAEAVAQEGTLEYFDRYIAGDRK